MGTVLGSQADVDAFDQTSVTGNLTIQGMDIRSLKPLRNLISVSGTLRIQGNALLKNLAGLEGLKEVGEFFWIQNNPVLVSVSELKKLKNSISGFCALKEGLTAEVDVPDFGLNIASLLVLENPNLVSIDGFRCLTSTESNIRIQNNTKLRRINGFDVLETVGGSIVINFNDLLECIPLFAALHTIVGDLSIFSSSIEAICGFESLETVGAVLTISRSPPIGAADTKGLIQLCGFNKLKTVQNVTISSNNLLKSITGFRALTQVVVDLRIMENLQLTSIDGFSRLQSAGSVELWDNFSLFGIDGLIGLTSVQNNFRFVNNHTSTINLLQVYGLSSLKSFGEDGLMQIVASPVLQNYFGLQPLANEEYPTGGNFQVTGTTKAAVAALNPPNPRDFYEAVLDRFVLEGVNPSVIKALSLYIGCPLAIKAAVSCGGLNQAQANVLLQGLQVEAFQPQLFLLPPQGPALQLQEPAKSAKPSKYILFSVACR